MNDRSVHIPLPSSAEGFSSIYGKVSFERKNSIIPLSYGVKYKGEGDDCLVIFFHQPGQKENCASFTRTMNEEHVSNTNLLHKSLNFHQVYSYFIILFHFIRCFSFSLWFALFLSNRRVVSWSGVGKSVWRQVNVELYLETIQNMKNWWVEGQLLD